MFSKIVFVFFFAISSNLAWAEEGSGSAASDQTAPSSSGSEKAFPQFPFFPDFSAFLQNFPGLGSGSGSSGFGSLISGLGGSRHERSAEEPDSDNEEQNPDSRFFFTLFPTITSCNYTTSPGRSCSSCTQSLTCLRNNVGLVRNCRGLFRHCNDGRCSLRQSAACSGAATTTAPADATTAAATTAAATTAAPTTTA